MQKIYPLFILIVLAGSLFSQAPPSLNALQGGEDIATAFVLSGPLPIITTGTTENYLDDYDEACPYEGGTAPDVVYAYTPAANITVDFDLCGSLYDTKIFVYENEATPGNAFACNDDYYYSETCGYYVSKIEGAYLTGGNTYYIVIDGYDTEFGEYTLTINESNAVQCNWGTDLICPPDALAESETCGNAENDGCDMFPGTENWEIVPSTGATFCGTFWADLGTHDADWYQLTLTSSAQVILTADGTKNFLYGLVETTTPGAPECATLTGNISPSGSAGACNETFLDLGMLSPGIYWFYVGMTAIEGYPCTNNYKITFDVIPTGCPQPVALTASNVTAATADLGWTEAGTASLWEYELGPYNFIPAGTGIFTNANPVSVSGLSANSTYDFYVRSVCGEGDTSLWAGPHSFTTNCIGAVSVPWSEGFENTWPPACWTDPATADFGWDQDIYGTPHSGASWAYCNLAGSVLTTPEINLSADAVLSFWYRVEDPLFPQALSVKIGENIIYEVSNSSNANYRHIVVSLAAYTGQSVMIAFTGNSGSGGGDYGICLDDVSVRLANTWTGAVSINWENPANWSNGSVPVQDDRVLIPSSPVAGRFPQINNGISGECDNVILSSGASLLVKAGGTLNVKNP